VFFKVALLGSDFFLEHVKDGFCHGLSSPRRFGWLLRLIHTEHGFGHVYIGIAFVLALRGVEFLSLGNGVDLNLGFLELELLGSEGSVGLVFLGLALNLLRLDLHFLLLELEGWVLGLLLRLLLRGLLLMGLSDLTTGVGQ